MIFLLSEIGLPCGRSTVAGWTYGSGKGRHKYPPRLDVREMEIVAAMRLIRNMRLLDIVRVTNLHINAVYNFVTIDMVNQSWSVGKCLNRGCHSPVVFDKSKGLTRCASCIASIASNAAIVVNG